jgi:hypothetical protein
MDSETPPPTAATATAIVMIERQKLSRIDGLPFAPHWRGILRETKQADGSVFHYGLTIRLLFSAEGA